MSVGRPDSLGSTLRYRPPIGHHDNERGSLRPYEAGLVLQMTERQVHARVRDGELRDVSRDDWARLDPDEVSRLARGLVEHDELSALAEWVLEEVLGGEHVNQPPTRDTKPIGHVEFLRELRSSAHVPQAER